MALRATRQVPRHKAALAARKFIRIGDEGSHAGGSPRAIWLTLEQAERVASELALAIKEERALRPQVAPQAA